MKNAVWIFNFDADEEFAVGVNYTSKHGAIARSSDLVERAKQLLGPNDHVLQDGARADGLVGRAFAMTPNAEKRLRASGATPAPAPAFDIQQRVNHRHFCFALGRTLPGTRWLASTDELNHAMRELSPGENFRLRAAFGFSGRGTKRIRGGEPLDASTQGWVTRQMREHGGVELVPWVDRIADYGWHGYIAAKDGAVSLGEPTTQQCDVHGQWVATTRALANSLSETEFLLFEDTMRETVEALKLAGYCGPFGIDAFRYRDANGAIFFHPRCDVNARYSMGWAIGMGSLRPDLEEPTA